MTKSTPEEAIAKLDAMDYDVVNGPLYGPGDMHEEADAILLETVPPEVAAAYERLVNRCNWWAYA